MKKNYSNLAIFFKNKYLIFILLDVKIFRSFVIHLSYYNILKMKKKIKVLQVIPKLGYGGAETGCYDLAHFLAEQGCKSFIITSGGPLIKFIKKKS